MLIFYALNCFSYLIPWDLNRSEVEAIESYYKPRDPTNETETLMSIGELYGDVTYKCPVQEVAKVMLITIFAIKWPPSIQIAVGIILHRLHCGMVSKSFVFFLFWF